MSLYLNMANAPVKIWGKFSQYVLQILDFTLNMPHAFLGPVAPPPYNTPPPPPGGGGGFYTSYNVCHVADSSQIHNVMIGYSLSDRRIFSYYGYISDNIFIYRSWNRFMSLNCCCDINNNQILVVNWLSSLTCQCRNKHRNQYYYSVRCHHKGPV